MTRGIPCSSGRVVPRIRWIGDYSDKSAQARDWHCCGEDNAIYANNSLNLVETILFSVGAVSECGILQKSSEPCSSYDSLSTWYETKWFSPGKANDLRWQPEESELCHGQRV